MISFSSLIEADASLQTKHNNSVFCYLLEDYGQRGLMVSRKLTTTTLNLYFVYWREDNGEEGVRHG